ncbi:MarR family transcriptional regulator [Vagococcus fluvialis]|uniref:MarR family transcriptional regulator n=1 Tax=Vagococcus fluvialis TaxID=2738 RepID=UPI0022E96DF0|nr:helix-turn-helix domain-containing protein [Vagococcus fluvialis]
MNVLEANIFDTMTFLRYGDPLERNQKWLLKKIDTPELQELAEKLSILSSQVLNEIARNNNQSAADIANELNVTRGGISQVAKRL